jgi:transposase
MPRTGRPKAELVLSAEERSALEGWVRRRATPQAWALRCRIILACATGASNKAVAAELGSTPHAVGRWRARFIQYRIAGLGDMPRPGGPRTVDDRTVLDVVTKTLTGKPGNASHWSTRSMAKEMGLSQSTVARIWRAFGLQPQRRQTPSLCTNPSVADKPHDVVGLYLDPPERVLTICFDARLRVRAAGRGGPALPVTPALPPHETVDGSGRDATALMAAVDVATGKVAGSLRRARRTEGFLAFLTDLDRQVPAELEVNLVCDNCVTQKVPVVLRWLSDHPRFHLLVAGSSWPNLVQRWFSELADTWTRCDGMSIRALEIDIGTWIASGNSDPRPYAWIKTAERIRANLAEHLDRKPDSESRIGG